MTATLTTETFDDHDRQQLVEMLLHLIDNDYSSSEKITLYQASFSLHVKITDGTKPGVAAMDRFASTYTKAGFLLMQVLMKLLDNPTVDEPRAMASLETVEP